MSTLLNPLPQHLSLPTFDPTDIATMSRKVRLINCQSLGFLDGLVLGLANNTAMTIWESSIPTPFLTKSS